MSFQSFFYSPMDENPHLVFILIIKITKAIFCDRKNKKTRMINLKYQPGIISS